MNNYSVERHRTKFIERTGFGWAALALMSLAFASGCRATSVAYRFTPSPLEALVQDGEGGPLVARVLVGVPGAEREDRKSSGYPLLVVSVRIENKSDETITFDPTRTVLLGPDLAEFGGARSSPEGLLRIEADSSKGALLYFPFPRDTSDLNAPLLTGVNMQFVIGRPTGDLEVSVTLERNEATYLNDSGSSLSFGAGYYYGCW